jgi:adenosylcobinamide-GDP ribazoletransferase
VLILGVIAAASKAMHYDALADVADGLLGGHSAQGKLEIMEDSAIGAFGATAVAFSVVAQGAALTGVVQNTAWYAIIVGCVVARASASVALWTLPAAREIGLVAPLVGRPRAGTVLVALLGVLALGALGFVVVGNDFSSIALTRVPFAAWPAHQIRGFVACLVGALAAGFILPRLLARPIKGITGDVVGASILITTGFCFAVAALFG